METLGLGKGMSTEHMIYDLAGRTVCLFIYCTIQQQQLYSCKKNCISVKIPKVKTCDNSLQGKGKSDRERPKTNLSYTKSDHKITRT